MHELKVTQFDNFRNGEGEEEKCFETLGNWANGVFVDGSTRGAMSPWNLEGWGCNVPHLLERWWGDLVAWAPPLGHSLTLSGGKVKKLKFIFLSWLKKGKG